MLSLTRTPESSSRRPFRRNVIRRHAAHLLANAAAALASRCAPTRPGGTPAADRTIILSASPDTPGLGRRYDRRRDDATAGPMAKQPQQPAAALQLQLPRSGPGTAMLGLARYLLSGTVDHSCIGSPASHDQDRSEPSSYSTPPAHVRLYDHGQSRLARQISRHDSPAACFIVLRHGSVSGSSARGPAFRAELIHARRGDADRLLARPVDSKQPEGV